MLFNSADIAIESHQLSLGKKHLVGLFGLLDCGDIDTSQVFSTQLPFEGQLFAHHPGVLVPTGAV